ncbi:MAG: NAD(P)-dependent oxidoreductase [Phycisphaerae bacterium]|nr:NAD(P)-dependent oxidoreductase [Phycisphaerae bacterium]
MIVALTGGTGFLGQALIRFLVPAAEQVRALVRRPADEDRIRSWGAVPVRGDLVVPGGCDGLVGKGNILIHSAARVDLTGTWAEFRETTVEGTRRLLTAALPQQPARVVYVSSAVVYSPAAQSSPMCAERTPVEPASFNYYGRAKLEAENLVREQCDRVGCPWTIVRLGFLYGPENRAMESHFMPLIKGRWLFIVGSGENRIATLYVDDAARAVVLVATSQAPANRIYDVASDEPVNQCQFLDGTCDAMGLPRSRQQVGCGLARFFSGAVDLCSRITGKRFSFSRAMVALMSADQVIDAGRIRRELGWRPEVTFEKGIRLTRQWWLRTH